MRKLVYVILVITMVVLAATLVACKNETPTFPVDFVSADVAMGTVTATCDTGIIESGADITSGTAVTLTATANAGYAFDGWYAGDAKVFADATYTVTIGEALNLVAKFRAESYRLDYASADVAAGTVTSAIPAGQVAYRTAVTVTAVANEGYAFVGWYEGDTKVSADDAYSFSMPATALDLTAKFEAKQFALTYASADAAMGTVTSAAGATVAYGTSVTLTATPNTGYAFDGWYTGETKVSAEAAYTFRMPAAAQSLVARFVPLTYALSYTADPAMGTVEGTVTSGATVAYGTSVSVTATADEGYTFDGWYAGDAKVSADAAYTFTMTAANALTARFQANRYVLTYTSADEAQGSVAAAIASGEAVAHGASVSVTATANTGYAFDGWYESGAKVSADAAYTFAMPIGAKTLVARFSALTYPLIYSAETPAMGSIDASVTSDASVAYGTSITLTAVPADDGYAFDGWYEGDVKVGAEAAYSFTMPVDGKTLVARFSPRAFPLQYSAQDEATGSVECFFTSGADVDYKTSVTLTATPQVGYAFEGWYEGDAKVNDSAVYTFAMPVGGRTLVARFAICQYKLTYVYDAKMGAVESAVASGVAVTYRTEVTLTASANTGYNFVGWYAGDAKVGDEAAYTFVMPATAKSVEARFEAQKRTVTYYDAAVVYTTQAVDYDTKVNLPATPTKAGRTFVGWYADAALTTPFGGNAITEDTALYAAWNVYEITFLDWDDAAIGAVQKVAFGKNAVLPATPTRVGHVFAGWDSEAYFAVAADATVKATYTKAKYTVTFLLEEGGAAYGEAQQVEYLDVVTKPMTPTKAEYIFVAWQKDGAGYDFSLTVDEDLIIYATWQPIPPETFTVTFYDGEGEDKQVVDVQTVEKGTAAAAPATPKKEGYVFRAWDKAFDNVTADMAVYATYDVATYEVTFVYYVLAEAKESKVVVDHGAAAAAPAAYQRTGYTFTGWDKAFDNVTADLTVTAQYVINIYTATYFHGDVKLSEGTAVYGATFAVPATPTVAGYSFMGWYRDPEFEVAFDFAAAATADVAVYARFTAIVYEEYTVDFLDYDGSVFSTQTVVEGGAAIDPGTPIRTGYTFTSWDKAFDNVTADLTVTAQYVINTYTITYLRADRTTVIDTRTVNYGTDATALVAAPAEEGKTFSSWSADLSYVTKAMAVYARYAALPRTVYFVDGEVTLYTQTVDYGATASVPTTPTKDGYIFVGWCADNLLTEAYDFNTPVTDEAGTYVYAKWEEASGIYTVYFKDYLGVQYGNTQQVASGKYAIEPPDPDEEDYEGYIFDGWYIEGTDTKFNFDTMPITRSITLVARAKA